jgi:hypothetical protein
MLLTISTTHRPATVLGPLLQRDLDDVDLEPLPFGHAMVCFSQADDRRCTAAVMVHAQRDGSSQLGMALAEVFAPTIHGFGGTEPALAARALPFEVDVPVLPTGGGAALVRRLFEPLGYQVTTAPVPADAVPVADDEPGELAVTISGVVCASQLLAHLSVLLPVLDAGDHRAPADETALESVLAEGEGWIGRHPAVASITHRYGGHRWPRNRRCSSTA